MRSPRFPDREPILNAIFSSAAIKRVWRDKIRIAMRARYVQDPIEFLDFHVSLDTNSRRIEDQIKNGSYKARQPLRILLEKSKGLCRQIVLPDVVDSIVLQCLSDSLYNSIRGKSPSPFAFFEPDSFKFAVESSDSNSYGSFAAWLHFQNRIFSSIPIKEFVVVTDIANYYDYIGYVNLRNVLSSHLNVPEIVLDLLISSLGDMIWCPDYMPRVDVGLPQVDLDAPRALAHCFLFDLDKFAESQKDCLYTRYMDDINFFCDSIYRSKQIVRDVDLTLHARQIRLNSGKTIIMSSNEARFHFRMKANDILEYISKRIESNIAKGLPCVREGNLCSKIIRVRYKSRYFDNGYGEKILKRLLSLCRKTGSYIQENIITDIINRRPGSREAIYRYISHFELNKSRLSIMVNGMIRREAVDAASYLIASKHIVESLCRSHTLDADLIFLTNQIGPEVSVSDGDGAKLFAKLWIMSKYGAPDDIITVISFTYDSWRVSQHLGRLVAGMMPLLFGTKHYDFYRKLVESSRNSDAISVLSFFDNIIMNPRGYSSVRPFVRAPNKSKSTGINHSKLIIMMCVFHSKFVSAREKRNLIEIHYRVWRDHFYSQRAKFVLDPTLAALIV